MLLSRRCTPVILSLFALPAFADSSRPLPNFTGPLVTPSVNSLPSGWINIEPYLIHTQVRGVYDGKGRREAYSNKVRQWQLALPLIYGLTDTTLVQLTLTSLHSASADGHSNGMRMGDSSLRVLQRLSGPGVDGTGWVTSLAVSRRLPTGRYHRLDSNAYNGTGTGVKRTSFSLGAQKFFWLANEHAIRLRGQVAWSPAPAGVHLRDTSVYGTRRGFRGSARPGHAWNASLAAEYVVSRQWVVVGEAIWDRTGRVKMHANGGRSLAAPEPLAASRSVGLAPAVEYHFNENVGLIAGIQWSVAGRNASNYVAPQAALNVVF
jgi:hypothetical protein